MRISAATFSDKRGYFFSNVEVHFDEKNIFVPDFVVVLKKNETILSKGDFIHGLFSARGQIFSRRQIYILLGEKDLALLDDEEKAAVKSEVPVFILDGFTVNIRNIFSWYFE